MRLAWDSKDKVRKDEARASGSYSRERSDDLYHSARWTRVSRAWRASHPLCANCRRQGRVTAGEVTDHIVPWPVCGDFFDDNNFQTLCQACNHDKGQRDKSIIQQWRSQRGVGGQNL